MIKINRFSKLTIGLAVYIIISASFMRQVYNFLVTNFGNDVVKKTFFSLFFAIFLFCLIYILIKKINVLTIALSVSVFSLAYLLILNQPYLAEKVHVIEYGLLGYIALRDLLKNNKIFKGILKAFLFISIIGIMDEAFQGILPYRVGEIRDVITNIVSGLLGISQYLFIMMPRRDIIC